MIGWDLFGVGAAAVIAGIFIVIRRLTRWNDPDWDTLEHQAEAFLWSERSGSGW